MIFKRKYNIGALNNFLIMNILNIVDNKYRDLWGLYGIREKLKEKNINLYFCNKYNWNLAINYINPSMIILPHIRSDSPHFQKIVHTAHNKKIKIIVYPSESLDYRKEYLLNEFPEDILDKIDKIFMWSEEQGQFISEKHKEKIVITGTTRFYGKKLGRTGKIKTIGLTSSGRYLAPLTGKNNVLYYINSRHKDPFFVGCIKNEVEFTDFFCKLIKLTKEINIELVFKPHPFEKISFYKEAFPDLKIENDPDIRVFYKKIDVCLNQSSSANLQALSNEIPVININNALTLDKEYKKVFDTYLPFKLGVPINDVKEIKKLFFENNIEDLFQMNVERGDVKALKEIAPEYETIKIISDVISKMELKVNN